IEKVIPIGDVISSYDPAHAALPWAAFRFTLQVCLSKRKSVDYVIIAFEKTSYIINRCTVYEGLSIWIRNCQKLKEYRNWRIPW
ncbi:hypothetical protein FPQ18DRAFT_261600, partial [Pyronema domesticum]